MFRAIPSTLRASRGFSTSLIRRNVIQELYLKELKSVNLKPITAADAQGSVKPWAAPATPKIPELELQSAEALKEYASANVETVSEASEQTTEVEEGDWLVLEELEDAHHWRTIRTKYYSNLNKYSNKDKTPLFWNDTRWCLAAIDQFFCTSSIW